jgi:hypothetical protein
MSNPLVDILPPKYRKAAYGVLALAGLLYSAYTVAGGDWHVALGSLFASLVLGTAHANTPKPVMPYHEGNAKPGDHRGEANVDLLLLVLTFVGVVLLLFRVHF